MNWNEHRSYYSQKYGPTSIDTLSKSYQAQKKRSPSKKSPKRSPKKSPVKPLNINKIIANTPASRKAKIASAKKLKVGEGRGSPTRGWGILSPTRRERHSLKEKCGNKAFLLPDQEKFPVQNNKCEYVCQGIQAAKNRACQYGYYDVAEKADRLAVKHCKASPKKQGCNKRIPS